MALTCKQKLLILSEEAYVIVWKELMKFCESCYLENYISTDVYNRITYYFKLSDYIIYILYDSIEITFEETIEHLVIRRAR